MLDVFDEDRLHHSDESDQELESSVDSALRALSQQVEHGDTLKEVNQNRPLDGNLHCKIFIVGLLTIL